MVIVLTGFYEGYNTFEALQQELLQHMNKEELVLFPYIKEIEKVYKGDIPSCAVINISGANKNYET
jgi:iron-sulfur cluster repair protein YtfE (RIC family)